MIRTAFGRLDASRLGARLRELWRDTREDERGDVPGWVLITLMTAGLATVTSNGFTSRHEVRAAYPTTAGEGEV